MIEDDCTVGPAVMVDQAEVGKEAHADCLEPTLVTQSEGIAVDLKRKYIGQAIQICRKNPPPTLCFLLCVVCYVV